ncbi:MAG: glycosyltransferase [Acidobacteria bacterium]|nr:glycosyltransferase [Acidobacteriota bacterium]
MKLAIINEAYQGGATRCARALVSGLQGKHQIRYFPEGTPEPIGQVLSALTAYQPDVVHCHSYYGRLPYYSLALVSRRYPTCFTPHDPRPIGTFHETCWDCSRHRTCFHCPLLPAHLRYSGLLNSYFRLRSYKRLVHRLTHSSLRLIAPSKWLKARLEMTELGRFEVHHIPNGVDTTRFARVVGARPLLGLPDDRKIILHVAYAGKPWTSVRRKGMTYLADAFVSLVLPRYPDALLVIVGEGLVPNHPNVRPMASVSNERLAAYYSAADVYVLATVADNLPYTVLEAMACETPVVASRVGGIPEQVEDGTTGLLVPPRDVP